MHILNTLINHHLKNIKKNEKECLTSRRIIIKNNDNNRKINKNPI